MNVGLCGYVFIFRLTVFAQYIGNRWPHLGNRSCTHSHTQTPNNFHTSQTNTLACDGWVWVWVRDGSGGVGRPQKRSKRLEHQTNPNNIHPKQLPHFTNKPFGQWWVGLGLGSCGVGWVGRNNVQNDSTHNYKLWYSSNLWFHPP